MKVRVLRNLGEGWPAYKEGEEVDADTTTGEALIKRGLAEAMPIQAVPQEPMKPVATIGTESTKRAKK